VFACFKISAACLYTCTICSVADVQNGEVCQMETFQAECPADYVIVVESAQLGRLKIGIYMRLYVIVMLYSQSIFLPTTVYVYVAESNACYLQAGA